MNELFTKKNILTIPNLLSVIRLIMIPFIIISYLCWENYVLAVILIAVSWITDVCDGYIARHFNQISDLGKILDPIADKLTEGAMIICLIFHYDLMIWLVIIFAISELLKALEGIIAIKKGLGINSAKWFGKIFTFLLYTVCIVLIIVPNINPTVANILIIACMVDCVYVIIRYTMFYIGLAKKKEAK